MSEHRTWGEGSYHSCTCGATGTRSDMDRHLYDLGAAQAPDDVQQLRRQLAAAEERIGTEIDWQHQIADRAKRENAEALDQQRRQYEDAMDRWHHLGRQADQLLTAAKRTGRKTLRVLDFTEHTA